MAGQQIYSVNVALGGGWRTGAGNRADRHVPHEEDAARTVLPVREFLGLK